MSSPAVRQATRDLFASPAWPGALPYRETFNTYVDPDTIQGQWSTVRYAVTEDRRVCVGTPIFEETGEIEVQVFAERGTDFAQIESAFDAIRPVILGHLWPNVITIHTVGAMEVPSPGGAGLHVEATIPIRYTYEHQGGL